MDDFIIVNNKHGERCLFIVDQDPRSREAFRSLLVESSPSELSLSMTSFAIVWKFCDALFECDRQKNP